MTESARTADRAPGSIDWVFALAVLLVLVTFIRAMQFTPLDAFQGAAQKIIYLHVPAAWVGFLAFFLVAVAGGAYLWVRDDRLDRFAASSAEVGVLFTTVVLITGPIWGRPVWGTWWQWGDARLVSTLFLWFIFVGYLVLRGAVEDRATRARYSAVLGILGALLIPFVHLSVYLFRTIHPQAMLLNPANLGANVGTQPGDAVMPPEMVATLLTALVAFTLLYVAFVRARYQLAAEEDTVDRLSAA